MSAGGANHLFCFGLGYSARALAGHLQAQGWRVSGTCWTTPTASEWAAHGITAHVFDGTKPFPTAKTALRDVTHILVSIPPDQDGDPVLHRHQQDILMAANLRWLGYLSTTGVYGDRGGDWVDESTPPTPTTDRGQRRLEAEQAWQKLQRDHGLPLHIFRLAGIYGPGRNPLETVIRGEAKRVIKPGQVFSRIHRDDIATVLAASIKHPRPGAIYNLCDDEAAPPEDVIAHAARLLNMPVPPATPFEEAALSPMARSFYGENKRVRNNLIKTELGVTLRYPTYREGLAALLTGIQKPGHD